jgi:hypothetical protein
MRSASLRSQPHVHTTYVFDLWYAAHGRARDADFFAENPSLCIPTKPLLPSTLVRLCGYPSAVGAASSAVGIRRMYALTGTGNLCSSWRRQRGLELSMCIYALRFRSPYVIFLWFQGFHATPLSMTLCL